MKKTYTLQNRIRSAVGPAALRLACVTAALAAAASLSACNKKTVPPASSTASTAASASTATTATTGTTIATTATAYSGQYPTVGWCNATTLNVRQTPSQTDYVPIGGLHYGEKVTILGKENGDWFKISFKGGVAYVKAAYISMTEVATTAPADTTTTAATTASTAAAQ